MDQLDLYNDALLLLGQRQLASLTEDREPRYRLDGAFNREAIRYCLELVKPNFASKTEVMNTGSPGATFDLSHTLPSDYVSIITPFSDKRLDQEINRYIIEGKELLCDYETVYMRYISDGYDLTDWTPSFFRVVGAYLARETANRLSPDDYVIVETKFKERVEAAATLEQAKVPKPRASDTTVTMTDSWRHIYNDALQILGLDEITTNDDDSNRRSKLDRTLDSGLVADILEDTGWQFGFQSIKIYFDPSVEPSFGHRYAIPKPTDLHRLDGIYTDEHMVVPMDRYADENSYWFCAYQEAYVMYISKNFLANPDAWPNFFRRYVAATMAKDAAPTLDLKPDREDRVNAVYEERKSSAMATDAMQSPPRKIAEGNWTQSRFRGGFRGRP